MAKTKNIQQAKVIAPEDVENLRRPLPLSWKKAAGILRGKRINALEYQKKIRQEWDRRLKNLRK